jgi:CBS domain-containing protein
MRVKDVMANGLVSVSPHTSVAEALDTMTRAHCSGLPVIDEAGELVGVISEADFLHRSELGTERPGAHWLSEVFRPDAAARLYAQAHGRRVEEIMTKNVATVDEGDSLNEAVAVMEKRRVKRLPVLAEGKVVGMITRADFVRALALSLREPYDLPIVPDEEIKRRIGSELQTQSWAPIAPMGITVKNGDVTLRGTLTQEIQRRAIHALVENVEGVRSVEDRMIWVEPYSGVAMD